MLRSVRVGYTSAGGRENWENDEGSAWVVYQRRLEVRARRES